MRRVRTMREEDDEDEADDEDEEDEEDEEDGEDAELCGGVGGWNETFMKAVACAIPTHGTSANLGQQPRRLDTQL